MTQATGNPLGCLMIDDPVPGEHRLSGLSLPDGLRPYPFQWRTGETPLPGLQALLHRARSQCGAACVLARGAGCLAALALAEQLPVERLALIRPAALTGRMRRLSGYALRNLALCVSDALIVDGADARLARRLERGLSANGRVERLPPPDKTGPDLCTICENRLRNAVFAFLRGEDLPKDLAKTPEMRYNL